MRNHPVTWFIFAATVLTYVGGNFQSLWLWPLHSPDFRWWQLFTYAFTHANALHLTVNCLAILSFGPSLEDAWGRGKFMACYAACAVAGGALQLSVAQSPTVGASGALFGLFAAYAIHFPNRKVTSIFPVPLPVWSVLGVYMVATGFCVAMSLLPQVAHLAHIGGVLVGTAFWATQKKTPSK